jgi:hypothetical protein
LTRTIEEYNVIAALSDTPEVIEFLLDYYLPFKMLPYPIVGATLYAARSAAERLNSAAMALSSVVSIDRPHNSAESIARTGVGSIRFEYKTVDDFVFRTRRPAAHYHNAKPVTPKIHECKSVDDFIFLMDMPSRPHLSSNDIGISKYLTRYLDECNAMMKRHLGPQYSDTKASFYEAMFAETKEKIQEGIEGVLPKALAKVVADYEEEMSPV